MITKIKIKNFQSHPDTELELDPGINIITGSSDNGKTSIFRALHWTIYNRPSGDSFISNWIKDEKGNIKKEEQTRIEINKKNKSLVRFKTKNKNGYFINEKELNAIGKDVPGEVSTFFNLNEVNFQRQLDGPFLFNDTPGQVAKFLNQLVDLSEIDKYLFAIDLKKRKNNNQIKTLTKNAEDLRNKLYDLDWVDDAKKLLIKAEENNELIHTTYRDELSLEKLLQKYKKQKEIIKQLKWIDKAVYLLSCFYENNELYTVTFQRKQKIDKLLKECKENISLLENNLDIEKINCLIKKLEKYQNKIKDFKTEKEILDKCISYHNSFSNMKKIAKEVIKTETEKLPDICPTCGSTLENKNE